MISSLSNLSGYPKTNSSSTGEGSGEHGRAPQRLYRSRADCVSEGSPLEHRCRQGGGQERLENQVARPPVKTPAPVLLAVQAQEIRRLRGPVAVGSAVIPPAAAYSPKSNSLLLTAPISNSAKCSAVDAEMGPSHRHVRGHY